MRARKFQKRLFFKAFLLYCCSSVSVPRTEWEVVGGVREKLTYYIAVLPSLSLNRMGSGWRC
jgi:hypothetical protein